jgi:hypothetical protein
LSSKVLTGSDVLWYNGKMTKLHTSEGSGPKDSCVLPRLAGHPHSWEVLRVLTRLGPISTPPQGGRWISALGIHLRLFFQLNAGYIIVKISSGVYRKNPIYLPFNYGDVL